jgi:hypothetical protein
MSSLREEVTQRRTAKTVESESVSVHARGSALIVCQWRGESWVLAARLNQPHKLALPRRSVGLPSGSNVISALDYFAE